MQRIYGATHVHDRDQIKLKTPLFILRHGDFPPGMVRLMNVSDRGGAGAEISTFERLHACLGYNYIFAEIIY